MKELNASPGKLISIGYEGEDKVTKIVFRYDEDWLAHGDGVVDTFIDRSTIELTEEVLL